MSKSIIAITGPSGAGKTTLGDKLFEKNGIIIPRHCTTRLKRNDDRDGFYRYLSHEKFRDLHDNKKFLISSGDGPIIKKEFGNFYGVLIEDCMEAWEESNIIILFVSYKDIYDLIKLKESGINIDIINLTFLNIEQGILSRISNDANRNHTKEDVESRINCALNDLQKYGEALFLHSKAVIYTDILDAEQTYDKVCMELKINRKK